MGCKNLAPVHHELCDFCQFGNERQIILIPRGHLKSTIVTIAYSVWSIVKNPNIRIYIGNEKIENAESFVSMVRKTFEFNTELRSLYGDYVGTQWSSQKLTVKPRTVHHKEPTIQAGAIGSSAVSQHYDLMIMDDLVSRQNTQTADLIQQTILYYQDCYDLIEPGGKFIVLGTRWHVDDLYGYLIENHNKQYDLFWKQAVMNGDMEKGEILFPQKFTREILNERLAMKGSFEFAAQYLNDPAPSDAAIFKERYFDFFKFYDTNTGYKVSYTQNGRQKDLTHSDLYVYTTIDPALSQSKEADFSVICTVAVDSEDNWFILEMKREHYTPVELADELFLTYVKFKPRQIGIEVFGFQKIIKQYIDEKQKALGYYMPIAELKYDNKTSKEYRIRGLLPRFERNKIFFNNEMRNLTYLMNELRRFPRIKHDDCLDALASHLEIAHRPRKFSQYSGDTPQYVPTNKYTGY